ncbi:Cytochrome P450 [Filimonas lacunae]|uniref:Cytochrome P450 n=1 Tax=Filimonas lacunae TaxID=477680 RepID=A0A173MLG9_9BACT|nr:cytochrome P450 [Filimonas lacunae]BAV08326.1 cytochrome P450 hydroxylase [Filimonas lacunae]SIT33369.1 Cytochrome P450 [Filimonas lacunae]
MSISNSLKVWVSSAPVLRPVFSILRKYKPVARIGKTVVVTRYKDVMDVLKRETDFTVYEIDGYKMERMGNPFVLGMDASPETTRDRDILRQVIKREDLKTIRVMIRHIANDLLEQAQPNHTIDTVNGYARLASVRVVAQYFGVPADEATMMRWQRSIFSEAFANLNDNKAIRERGMIAAKEIAAHLNQLIQQRQQQTTPLEDNVLNRLIQLQPYNSWLNNDAVRRNILCILGVVENTSKVVTHIIDQLLKRPDIMKACQQAVHANDMETLRSYCFDILRFNPHNPIILRYCKHGAVIGKDTPYERRVPAGSTIYAATLSAMFDEDIVHNAKQIDPNRNVEYMHFGYGPHVCSGKYISEVTVPELVAGLLRLKNLQRAPGKAGKIQYEEVVFPKSLSLTFN